LDVRINAKEALIGVVYAVQSQNDRAARNRDVERQAD
jgi:hypothetical protein